MPRISAEQRELNQAELVAGLIKRYGESPAGNILTREQIMEVNDELNLPFPHFIINKDNKAGRCQYYFPVSGQGVPSAPSAPSKPVTPNPQLNAEPALQVPSASTRNAVVETEDSLVPIKDPLFVPYGNAPQLKQVLKSGMFFPVLVTGLSGNGKTYTIKQLCAELKRPLVRVNLTDETDEDDLIGGFRLIDGDTRFFKGPVIRAMELGAVLLLDEIDLAHPARIMCLQSILEGSDYLIKKTGERVFPQPGFTIIATANTKGRGSSDGRFIGANVLNDAFLERFPVTFEQDYPAPNIEVKILKKLNTLSLNIDSKVADPFIASLVDWAQITRKTFLDGGTEELISTRRLVHILRAFNIFGDKLSAIQYCVNRFDEDSKNSFIDLYSKVDAEIDSNRVDQLLGYATADENTDNVMAA